MGPSQSKKKRKVYFAALKSTKLLCSLCGTLERVTKYLGEGRVFLACGHDRHGRESRVQEIERKLDMKARYE